MALKHRIFPLNAEVRTGSRVFKRRPAEMIDLTCQGTDKPVGIELDGSNIAIFMDYKTAIELAISLLEMVPGKTIQDHAVDGKDAVDRIQKCLPDTE